MAVNRYIKIPALLELTFHRGQKEGIKQTHRQNVTDGDNFCQRKKQGDLMIEDTGGGSA